MKTQTVQARVIAALVVERQGMADTAIPATDVIATAEAPAASAIGAGQDSEDRVSVAADAECVAAMCELRF